MTRYVDYTAEGTSVGRCVVLPGRQYTPDAPLLFFATQAALDRGWDVRQVWWEAPERGGDTDETAWVADQLAAAVEGYDGRVLVVGKSLGTLAAARAAAQGYAGAWLTPLLTDPEAAAPLTSYPAAQLVVIGSRDPYLDREVLDGLPGTRVLVEGDHVLRVPGDPAAMVSAHARFVEAFDAWLGTLVG
ncbi:MAG: hypothetical protein WCS84_06680 [Nocardioides sp.]